MTKSKQRNSRARSKQKRKMLRLKNKQRSISLKRADKIIKARKEKGQTFRSYLSMNGKLIKAKHVAIPIEQLYPEGGGGFLKDHSHSRSFNQRQKRKRLRQSPHRKK
jgi:hypothetical protein